MTTHTTFRLETFCAEADLWVGAPMAHDAADRVECEAMIDAAIEFAPGLATRRFRCVRTVITTERTEFFEIAPRTSEAI